MNFTVSTDVRRKPSKTCICLHTQCWRVTKNIQHVWMGFRIGLFINQGCELARELCSRLYTIYQYNTHYALTEHNFVTDLTSIRNVKLNSINRISNRAASAVAEVSNCAFAHNLCLTVITCTYTRTYIYILVHIYERNALWGLELK